MTDEPENAEHEIKTAYNSVIDAATVMLWDRSPIHGIEPQWLLEIYRNSYKAYRKNQRLAAERWARTARHLSNAYRHEAKIAYLEPRTNILPFLHNALDEYQSHAHSDTAADLLDSLAGHAPPGMQQMPEDMKRFYERGRKHLEVLNQPNYRNELLRAERIKAAHEYGRVVELMALAYECETTGTKAA